jgi:hypothetical protein
VNTTQQIGGALGVAFLNTVAASAARSWLISHHSLPGGPMISAVHGYTTAFGIGAALLIAAMVASLLISGRPPSGQPATELEDV